MQWFFRLCCPSHKPYWTSDGREVFTIIDSAAEEKIGGSAHLSDHSVVAQESK